MDFVAQDVVKLLYPEPTRRDSHHKPIDPISNNQGTVNCYIRRIIHDLPLLAYRCQIKIELAQVLT